MLIDKHPLQQRETKYLMCHRWNCNKIYKILEVKTKCISYIPFMFYQKKKLSDLKNI